MKSKTIAFVVGTRPNFVKAAPVIEALDADERIRQLVVHTGQHYDAALSDEILQDLGFPTPDRFLGIGSGTHAEQTGKTLIEVERVLLERATRPCRRQRGCQRDARRSACRGEAVHPAGSHRVGPSVA